MGKSFWKCWDTKDKLLLKKIQGNVAMNRALNCTHEMAINHLDELAEELIATEIFTDSHQHAPGKWTRKIDTSR